MSVVSGKCIITANGIITDIINESEFKKPEGCEIIDLKGERKC